MTLAPLVLGLVTAERLGELGLARRNTRHLLAQGAREEGAGHYPAIVALHGAWLAGLWLLASGRAVRLPWLAAYVVLQAARAWVILSLGERWTTRIIVPAGGPRLRRGPYRWLSHPNYAVVAGEIAVLPLALGLPVYAAVFSVLNAAILAVRIGAENRAWARQQASFNAPSRPCSRTLR